MKRYTKGSVWKVRTETLADAMFKGGLEGKFFVFNRRGLIDDPNEVYQVLELDVKEVPHIPKYTLSLKVKFVGNSVNGHYDPDSGADNIFGKGETYEDTLPIQSCLENHMVDKPDKKRNNNLE
jgi:hypothetical protein